jgi:hypothetical protein
VPAAEGDADVDFQCEERDSMRGGKTTVKAGWPGCRMPQGGDIFLERHELVIDIVSTH